MCCAFSFVEEEEDIIDLGPDVLESSNTPVYADVDDQSLVKEEVKEGLTEEYRGQDREERTEVNGDQENEEEIYVNEWLTETQIPTTNPMLLAELNVHVYNGHLNRNAIFSEQFKVPTVLLDITHCYNVSQ